MGGGGMNLIVYKELEKALKKLRTGRGFIENINKQDEVLELIQCSYYSEEDYKKSRFITLLTKLMNSEVAEQLLAAYGLFECYSGSELSTGEKNTAGNRRIHFYNHKYPASQKTESAIRKAENGLIDDFVDLISQLTLEELTDILKDAAFPLKLPSPRFPDDLGVTSASQEQVSTQAESQPISALTPESLNFPPRTRGWGPPRELYTVKDACDHIAFNSITNNPHINDERNFVGIRERNTNNQWSSDLQVRPNREYVIRLYLHNNADDRLGLVAEGVRAVLDIPKTTGKFAEIYGSITSDNSNPPKVWDGARMWSDQDFNLAYVSGSARLYNNHFKDGIAMPDELFTRNGTFIGFDTLDGRLPSGYKYDGVITVVVWPQFTPKTPDPHQMIECFVRIQGKTGTTSWQRSLTASPSDILEYKIAFRNTKKTHVDNIKIRSLLPNYVSYVEGTAEIYNTMNPNRNPTRYDPTGVGVDFSSCSPEGYIYVEFQAQVADAATLGVGLHELRNRVVADYEYGTDGFSKCDSHSIVTVIVSDDDVTAKPAIKEEKAKRQPFWKRR